MRVPSPFSPVPELQAVFQPLRRVVAPFHTLWILCRQVGPEYTCMDIYISRCSFLHDSTLVPVTTKQSRECMASRRLLQGSLQTLLHRPLSFNFIATLIFWYEKLKCTHPNSTPPSAHTRSLKLRNMVAGFPQPVCSLVTRHQHLAATVTLSGR